MTITRSALITALAVVTLSIPVTAGVLWATSDRPLKQAADAHWAEGITPEWMSAHMGLDLPASGRSADAAYETTSRFDTGLLTFTLPRADARRYLARHPPEGRWLPPAPSQPAPPAHDFTHLNLPEPETLRTETHHGDVCPTATDRCVVLWTHDYTPTRTRIYIRAHYEPGISPLPKA
ncbi:hypothetical protein ACGFZR_18705 [Streptomyces sp. NPDC048241]|uniref:hypothetical protein n=1 Tax=Streptomyces sp. NPDC048241 TaxID=3365521 RepID=UPI00371DC959